MFDAIHTISRMVERVLITGRGGYIEKLIRPYLAPKITAKTKRPLGGIYINKLKIYTDNDESFMPNHVEIDNNIIHGVIGITYHQSVKELLPQCTIETRGLPDIDTLADIKFKFTPETIQEAATILRNVLSSDKDFYDAFVASIESALDEIPEGPEEMKLCDVAKAIANRIIGEE